MDERSRRIEARLEIPMLVASALVVPLLIIEQEATTPAWREFAGALNWTIWLAFLGEVVVMLAVVPNRCQWIRRHPLEVIVAVGTAPILPASMQAFRAVRLLRLLRLVLLARRVKTLFTPGGLSYAAVLSLLAILAGGAALRVAEPSLDLSFADATWWALTTATTVGYGDIYPVTNAGRAIAGVVMVVGIGFVALLTAALAQQFVEPATDAIEANEANEDESARLLREIASRIDAIEARLSER